MSDLTTDELLELNLNRYLQLIAFTILIHEYCITFTREVERFWRHKRTTLVAAFFFLNRYFVPLGHVPVVFHNFWISTAHNKQIICHHLQTYHHYYVLIVQILVSVMLIVRTFALYGRSRRILALTVGTMGAIAIVSCWSIATKPAETTNESRGHFVVNGCASPISQALALRYAKDWVGLLVFDTLIFALTLYKTLLSLRTRYGSRSSILTLMLRDGSMFFGVMVVSNVANIVTFLYGGRFVRASASLFVNNLADYALNA